MKKQLKTIKMCLLKYFTAKQVFATHFIPFQTHFNMMVVEIDVFNQGHKI